MNSDTALLASAGGASAPAENLKDTYRKISWRIAPVLVTAYALAFVDRINIGFAQLQMNADLGFSDAIYGTGAGIFFLGYFLLRSQATCCSRRSAPGSHWPGLCSLGPSRR
jgi:sugar phosphate permease